MNVHVKDYRTLANFSYPLLHWNELTQNIQFNTKPCYHVIPSFPNSFSLLHELVRLSPGNRKAPGNNKLGIS